jgi:hypothetical protein
MTVWESVRDLENENAALAFQLEAQVAEMAELVAENALLTEEVLRLQAIIDGTPEEGPPPPPPPPPPAVVTVDAVVTASGRIAVKPNWGTIPVAQRTTWGPYRAAGDDARAPTGPAWPVPAANTRAHDAPAVVLDNLATSRPVTVGITVPGRAEPIVKTMSAAVAGPTPSPDPPDVPLPPLAGKGFLETVYVGPQAQPNWFDDYEGHIGGPVEGELVFASIWDWTPVTYDYRGDVDRALSRLASGRWKEVVLTNHSFGLTEIAGATSWEDENRKIAAAFQRAARGDFDGRYLRRAANLATFAREIGKARGITPAEAVGMIVHDQDHEMGGGWTPRRWAPDVDAAIRANRRCAEIVGNELERLVGGRCRFMWRNIMNYAVPNIIEVWDALADVMDHPGADIYDQWWGEVNNNSTKPGSFNPQARVNFKRTEGWTNLGTDALVDWLEDHDGQHQGLILGEEGHWGGNTEYGGGHDNPAYAQLIEDLMTASGVYAGRRYKTRSRYYFHTEFTNTDGGALHELKHFPNSAALRRRHLAARRAA